ncbi:large neutral amino acids transporter small subunit 4-like [Saccoglossus kowalevskii]|uniref:Large neutral amino acids transporter small subunit 4-like n=1 Tax=Saccoglossus kowalevskii TaxID=10224 RepID=A0ABM0GPH3_SACKO|nr:PREDICTED: large neutral amino acids transporter small subunit 4-like [Saccoglossus kowalevskii]
MAPTLFIAQQRRYWLLITNVIIENLFFSAVLLGWSSLLLILRAERFYAYLCDEELNTQNGTWSEFTYNPNETDFDNVTYRLYPTSNETVLNSNLNEMGTCSAQETQLNLAFTVGSFLLSGMTFPIGMAMDKFGSRILRMIGCFFFCASALILAFANPDTTSVLLFPAVALNGIGGITLVFTSLQVSNLFGHKRSTVISLCIGSYASSAILFPILKALYDLGVSRQNMFVGLAIGCCIVWLNCFLNVPSEAIPDPDDESFGIHWNILKLDNKVSGQHFYRRVSNVGRRLSTGEVLKQGDMYGSKMNLELKMKRGSDPTFCQSIFSPIFLWSLVVMCITQLRLLFFIGSFSQMVEGMTDDDPNSVELYAAIFGFLQLLCLCTCPLIGLIMDWKTKAKPQTEDVEEAKPAEEDANSENISLSERSEDSDKTARSSKSLKSKSSGSSTDSIGKKKRTDVKIQKLRNGVVAFTITNTACVFFGILVLIPILELQIFTFVLHTIIRGFIHSAVCSLYALQYPANQQGGLIGLQSLISAMFALLQYPVFVAIEGPLNQDPFYVNIVMLGVSFISFGLPIYLYWYSKKVEKELKAKRALHTVDSEPLFLTSRPSRVALLTEKNQPVAI